MPFRREGCKPLFQQGASPPFGGDLNSQCLQGPLADWAIDSSSGGRVSAPKLLFYVMKSSNHWSIKHEKKKWIQLCLVLRHVPSCLEAGPWGQPACRHLEVFLKEAASPCPGQCHPPSRYLFPRRQRAACLSDTSHHLPSLFVYAAVDVCGEVSWTSTHAVPNY